MTVDVLVGVERVACEHPHQGTLREAVQLQPVPYRDVHPLPCGQGEFELRAGCVKGEPHHGSLLDENKLLTLAVPVIGPGLVGSNVKEPEDTPRHEWQTGELRRAECSPRVPEDGKCTQRWFLTEPIQLALPA